MGGIGSDARVEAGQIILNEPTLDAWTLSRGIWFPMLQRMPRPPSRQLREAEDKEGQRLALRRPSTRP